jgi:sugar transferase (PEP-CTERM/EpsH1 system associated)
LYFVSRIPYPLEKGDKLRAYHQIKNLAINNDVYLAIISNKSLDEEANKELEKFVQKIYHYRLSKFSLINGLMVAGFSRYPFQVGYFFNSGAHLYFKKIINELKPDHIIAQLVRTSEYVRRIKGIQKSIDYMDAFSSGMQRRSERSKGILKWIFKKEAEKLYSYEKEIVDGFDNSFIISEQDAKSMSDEVQSKVQILPNGVDDEYFSPNPLVEKKFDIVFTGNMSYPPNIDAALFLANSIMPLVWKEIPCAKLLIAGATPTTQIKNLESDKIVISGWMDDIRSAYYEGKVFVAPLRIGSGLQNKLLEAMCIELPCITSPLANNALKAVPNESILVAESEEEYSTAIIELLKDDHKMQSIAKNGNTFVKQNYNWAAANEILEKSIFKN